MKNKKQTSIYFSSDVREQWDNLTENLKDPREITIELTQTRQVLSKVVGYTISMQKRTGFADENKDQ